MGHGSATSLPTLPQGMERPPISSHPGADPGRGGAVGAQGVEEPRSVAVSKLPGLTSAADARRGGERSVGELAEGTWLFQPAVSRHLRVLRAAGLVAVRVDAQRRRYRLRPSPLAEGDARLAPYRRFWADRLDALERHLDEAGEG